MIKLKSIQITQGQRDTDWHVVGYDADGREYTHERVFQAYDRAGRLVVRIKQAGMEINEDHWCMRVPYGSTAWIKDGCEEALAYEERYCGLGDGDELAFVY